MSEKYNLKYTGQEIDNLLEKTEKGTTSFKFNIATGAWNSDSTYVGYMYKAIVAVTGVKTNNNIIVGLAENATLEQEEACIAAGVQCKQQAENQITLYAKEKPTIALPMVVMILN